MRSQTWFMAMCVKIWAPIFNTITVSPSLHHHCTFLSRIHINNHIIPIDGELTSDNKKGGATGDSELGSLFELWITLWGVSRTMIFFWSSTSREQTIQGPYKPVYQWFGSFPEAFLGACREWRGAREQPNQSSSASTSYHCRGFLLGEDSEGIRITEERDERVRWVYKPGAKWGTRG